MIPKLICFLFGHIKWKKDYTDYVEFNAMNNMSYYRLRKTDECPRCGVRLLAKGEL